MDVININITGENSKASYRSELDGLRALAVIAVIINHLDKNILPSGYLGVDMFFVISGFVITSSLAGRRSNSFSDFLLGFYTRRIKRLVPALVLFIIITGMLICLFDPNPVASLRTGIASLFGFSNLYLLKQANDYFGPSSELNVFTHTWSLGVEEQFYFLFPCLIWLSGFGRLTAKGARNLLLIIVVLSVASLVSFVYLSRTNQPAAYFLMPTRLWELGVGCLLFLGLEYRNSLFTALEKLPPFLITAAVIGVLCIPLQYSVQATIAVVVLTAVLIACLRCGTVGYAIFSWQRVVYIGQISYSLYLWHWGVLSLSRWTIGIHWWSVPFQIALMLILSAASYRCVETPLRRAEWSPVRWKSIGYGIGASTISAAALVFLLSGAGRKLYSGTTSPTSEDISLKKNITEETGEKKEGTVFLIGDSHAGHFGGLAQSVADTFQMNYKSVTAGGTTFPTVNISTPVGGLTYAKNKKFNSIMLAKLEKTLGTAQPGDLIILSSFYRSYFETPSGSKRYRILTHYNTDGKIISQKDSLQTWLQQLELFSEKYKNTNIVVMLSTPEMPGIYPISLCTKEWFRRSLPDECNVSIARSQVVGELSRLNSAISEKASESNNLFIFDPTPSLCPPQDEYCRSHEGGNRLYSDEDHLTEYGCNRVKDDFIGYLVKNDLL